MNGFTITPFRGLHLLCFAYGNGGAAHILAAGGKPEARRSRFLIGVCLFNLALFAGYKLSLSMDAAYVRAYYPNGFNIFNELPLHLCNINLFLIPIGLWKLQPLNTGICLLCGAPRRADGAALPGAAVLRLFVVPAANFGYYVTHALLVVCGLSLATMGFTALPQGISRRSSRPLACLP